MIKWFKKKKTIWVDIDYENLTLDGLVEKAMECAAEANVSLDYSPDSIEQLEELLENYYRSKQTRNKEENKIWNMSLIFGSYLGQTLLYNVLYEKGYKWKIENGVPVLSHDESNIMSPISKVYKRLTEGSGDNVKSFYDVAIAIAEGKINFNK